MSERYGEELRSNNEILPNHQIGIMRRVGREFGVTVQTLAEEGEEYTNEKGSYRGIVDKGKSYVRITHQTPDLSKFYRAVEAEQAKQPPTNRPKI